MGRWSGAPLLPTCSLRSLFLCTGLIPPRTPPFVPEIAFNKYLLRALQGTPPAPKGSAMAPHDFVPDCLCLMSHTPINTHISRNLGNGTNNYLQLELIQWEWQTLCQFYINYSGRLLVFLHGSLPLVIFVFLSMN